MWHFHKLKILSTLPILRVECREILDLNRISITSSRNVCSCFYWYLYFTLSTFFFCQKVATVDEFFWFCNLSFGMLFVLTVLPSIICSISLLLSVVQECINSAFSALSRQYKVFAKNRLAGLSWKGTLWMIHVLLTSEFRHVFIRARLWCWESSRLPFLAQVVSFLPLSSLGSGCTLRFLGPSDHQ